jgi:phage protein U
MAGEVLDPLTMMQLGDYKFGLNTAAYQEITRTQSWRWASQQRLGRGPARNYLGSGDDSITLNGVIMPTFRGGLAQIDAMRTEAEKGTPLPLMDSNGYPWGRWCIEQLTAKASAFLPGGAPRKIEFTLKISLYGEDA